MPLSHGNGGERAVKLVGALLFVLLAWPFAGWAQFASNDDFTAQQYRDFAHREPTTAELSYWASTGLGQSPLIIRSIINGAWESYTTAPPIIRLYFAYFNRIPDYGGFSWWSEQLYFGTSDLRGASFAFAGSAEFVMTYGILSNSDFVRLVYQNVLQRQPDQGGHDYWTGQLNQGMARPDLMLYFSEAAEHVNLRASTVIQVLATARMVHRMPTSVQQNADPDAFVGSMLASSEYVTRLNNSYDAYALLDCDGSLAPRIIGTRDCVNGDVDSRMRRRNYDGGAIDPARFNQLAWLLMGLGNGAVAYPASHDASPLTGFPIFDYQRPTFQRGDQNDLGAPTYTSSFSLYQGGGAAVVNSWWFTPQWSGGTPGFSIATAQYGAIWQVPSNVPYDAETIQVMDQYLPGRRVASPVAFAPFADPDAQLMMQALVKVPTAVPFLSSDPEIAAARGSHTPQAQLNFYVYFLDRSTGTFFGLVVQSFSSIAPAAAAEGAGCEDRGGHLVCDPFVGVRLPADQTSEPRTYIGPSPFSRGFTSGMQAPQTAVNAGGTFSDERFFRFHLTRKNMFELVRLINSGRLPGKPMLSTNLADYLLTDAAIGSESAYYSNPSNPSVRDNITIGWSFRGFGVWRLR